MRNQRKWVPVRKLTSGEEEGHHDGARSVLGDAVLRSIELLVIGELLAVELGDRVYLAELPARPARGHRRRYDADAPGGAHDGRPMKRGGCAQVDEPKKAVDRQEAREVGDEAAARFAAARLEPAPILARNRRHSPRWALVLMVAVLVRRGAPCARDSARRARRALGVMPVMLGNALSVAARHVALDALLDLVHYPVDRGLDVALEGVRVELSLGIAAEAGYKRGKMRETGRSLRRGGPLPFYQEPLVGHRRYDFLGFHSVETVAFEGLVDAHAPSQALGVLQDSLADLGKEAARSLFREAAVRFPGGRRLGLGRGVRLRGRVARGLARRLRACRLACSGLGGDGPGREGPRR